jgi:hypothetical protein
LKLEIGIGNWKLELEIGIQQAVPGSSSSAKRGVKSDGRQKLICYVSSYVKYYLGTDGKKR